MGDFFQDGPRLGNQYDDDPLLREHLRRRLGPALAAELEPGLRRLGARAGGEMLALAQAAEAQPPRHVPYDPWGRRVDRIDVSPAWEALGRIAVEERIVAAGYDRGLGAAARVHQLARLYLYAPSSAIYACPLAMTDGAVRAIEVHGDAALKARALPRLLAADPAQAWTSGQWMTERTGGSDVSGTATVARRAADGYRLHGTKWFTSATTAEVAMTLARVEGAPEGSRGLSLFFVELRDEAGRLQGISVNRLKEKLGTRALPTAELTLDGAPATLVGAPGRGVRAIATLFNITRIYNAACAAGALRRGLALARDYARRRRAFGRPLAEQPLHLETLAALAVEAEAAFLLVFHVAELLGKEEAGTATAGEQACLRILTPVAKLYTAKQAIQGTSEVLESFGGAGYIEDTGLPALLRDAQVLAIWEGTTNVLALDVLRAIARDGALRPLLADVAARLGTVAAAPLAPGVARARGALERIAAHAAALAAAEPDAAEAGARRLGFALARTTMAALMLERADWAVGQGGGAAAVASALRFAGQELAPLAAPGPEERADSRRLALGEDQPAAAAAGGGAAT
ncbi:MAG TPA: acyl-CoA dehydrogenase family protein [Polyangia bacterium]